MSNHVGSKPPAAPRGGRPGSETFESTAESGRDPKRTTSECGNHRRGIMSSCPGRRRPWSWAVLRRGPVRGRLSRCNSGIDYENEGGSDIVRVSRLVLSCIIVVASRRRRLRAVRKLLASNRRRAAGRLDHARRSNRLTVDELLALELRSNRRRGLRECIWSFFDRASEQGRRLGGLEGFLKKTWRRPHVIWKNHYNTPLQNPHAAPPRPRPPKRRAQPHA